MSNKFDGMVAGLAFTDAVEVLLPNNSSFQQAYKYFVECLILFFSAVVIICHANSVEICPFNIFCGEIC